MTKAEFIKLMKFPVMWESTGMYPDELFQSQISAYEPGHEDGSEHDRNGAFHWWLRRNPSVEELEKLIRLAAADPDRILGEDLRQYFHRAENYNIALSSIENELFS